MANEVEIIVRSKDETDFRGIRRKAIKESTAAGKDSSHSFTKSFGSTFTVGASKFFGNLAENATGIFGRAFGTASSSNPYIGAGVMAAITTAVTVGAPAIGVALGGGIVTGLGAGLAGLGLMFAAKNKEVQKKWDELTSHMGKKMEEAAKPFVPVVLRGIERIKRVFDQSLAPALANSFKTLAPAVDQFFATLEVAFRDKAVTKAIQDISNAMVVLVDALSPVIVQIIVNLAKAFSQLAISVGKNPEAFASLVALLGKIAVAVVKVIDFLYKAGAAFNSLPGPVKKNIAIFMTLGAGMLAIINTIKLLKAAWDRIANLKAKANIDIGPFVAGVRNAISQGLSFARRVFKAVLSADIGGVGRALGDALAKGREWAGRVFTATFNVKKVISTVAGGLWPFAHGGVRGAAGGGPRGGLTLVGEQGPELVNIPAGSRVVPNGKTRQMMGSGSQGGSGDTFIFNFPNYVGDTEDLMRTLKKAIRAKRGKGPNNVQEALG